MMVEFFNKILLWILRKKEAQKQEASRGYAICDMRDRLLWANVYNDIVLDTVNIYIYTATIKKGNSIELR